jgi:hypothetical protein
MNKGKKNGMDKSKEEEEKGEKGRKKFVLP